MNPADGSTWAISATGLRRSFGTIDAVAGVNLEIAPGEIFGLLGPDGAGKTTLIRMLATVLSIGDGHAQIFGHSVRRQPGQVTPLIGYMSQRFAMYPDLSVAENLEFLATVRGVSRKDRIVRADELLTSMGLAEFRDRQARNLSGGMKQKLMLASTLMHKPRLLLLDEPTTGVDPVSRREFWRILANLNGAGTTVVVATPYMDEAERCTKIGFMDAGQLRRVGTPSEIKAQVPGTLLAIDATTPREILAVVAKQTGVASAHLFGNSVRVLWTATADPVSTLAKALAAMDVPHPQIRVIPMDMESAFTFLAEAATTPPVGQVA